MAFLESISNQGVSNPVRLREMTRVLLFAMLLPGALAHAPPYGSASDVVCDATRADLAPVTSFHTHIHFMQNNNVSVADAKAVHDAFESKFFNGSVTNCKADFHQDGLCVWENDPYHPNSVAPL